MTITLKDKTEVRGDIIEENTEEFDFFDYISGKVLIIKKEDIKAISIRNFKGE